MQHTCSVTTAFTSALWAITSQGIIRIAAAPTCTYIDNPATLAPDPLVNLITLVVATRRAWAASRCIRLCRKMRSISLQCTSCKETMYYTHSLDAFVVHHAITQFFLCFTRKSNITPHICCTCNTPCISHARKTTIHACIHGHKKHSLTKIAWTQKKIPTSKQIPTRSFWFIFAAKCVVLKSSRSLGGQYDLMLVSSPFIASGCMEPESC